MSRAGRSPATVLYRLAAAVTARILGSSRLVESVLVHRSVATGEVRLGRSDIDLLLFIHQDQAHDGPALGALCRQVRIARCLNPALGHIEVHDPAGWRSWLETDTCRGSLERRSATSLRGSPVAMPAGPVRPQDALRRFGLELEGSLTAAVRRGDRHSLRKIVLDAWSDYAIVAGLAAEPPLTRGEAAIRLRATEDGAALDRLCADASQAGGYVLGLASRLHETLLPALQPLARPVVFQVRLPPRCRTRTFVVLPEPGSLGPADKLPRNAFLCTPQALELYLHHVSPFLWWSVPPELRSIGLGPPSVEAFLRSCHFYAQSVFLRTPGFINAAWYAPELATSCVAHALPWLARGELPPPVPEERILEVTGAPGSCADYYRRIYGRLYRQNQELWALMTALPRRPALLSV